MKLLLPLFALLQSYKVAAADFTSITVDGSYDNIKSVVISPSCPSGGSNKVPVTMFTILPSESGVEVSSDPPDLVSVSSDGNTLSINSWNVVDSKSGGVKISLPPSQLTSVSASADTDVQILDGFTALKNIDLSGDSDITATVSSAATSPISISVQGDSTLTLSAASANVEGTVSGDSEVYLEAPAFDNFEIMGDSEVEVKGNVGSGKVMGDSTLSVTGEVSGSVSIMGDSEFNAPSCDNVVATGDSTCSTGAQDVEVDTSEQPMTKSVGSFSCGGNSITTVSGDNGETIITCSGDGCNGAVIYTSSMIGVTIAAVAIAFL